MNDGYFNKKLRKKKCRQCGNQFEPYTSLSMCCSVKCSLEYNRNKDEQLEKAVWVQKKKIMKEKLKSRSDWLKDLEREINAIVRLIDHDCFCISCGGHGKPQAGHYFTVKAHPALRFNLHNIHIQDYRCNVELSANITGYDDGLISVYGEEYYKYLKFGIRKLYPELHLSVPEIAEYTFKAREIKKELQVNLTKKITAERLLLRDQINERIGIYKTKN